MSRIIKRGLALAALSFASIPATALAATNIWYSAGQNTTDHKTCISSDCVSNPLTVTIDGTGTATFSTGQTGTTTGIGDVVTYGGSRAFISGRTSSTVWKVQTAVGGLPAATTSAPVASIAHAFASVKAAIGTGSANATTTNYLNVSDWSLVNANYVLNIPVYYDTGPDTNRFVIRDFVTGPNNYIRIYTPTSTAEVNASQRHSGVWDSTKWSLDGSFSYAAAIETDIPYIRLDGLQLRNTTTLGAAYTVYYNNNGGIDDEYLSNSLISTGSSMKWPAVRFQFLGASYAAKIWNNVFFTANTGIAFIMSSTGAIEVYNNTFYDLLNGVTGQSSGSPGYVFRNNVFASTSVPFSWNMKAGTGSDYNTASVSTTTLGYSVIGGAPTHDYAGATINFIDIVGKDFHFAAGTTNIFDNGYDASADPALPFSVDFTGEARPIGSAWDRGADEYNASYSDVTPPVRSAGSPSGAIATSTTSTTVSLLTAGENSTCKYSLTPGTAYALMTNTFANTGTTTHAMTISGLSSGHVYTYYVRCIDGAGNANTDDYAITFNTGTNGTAYANSCSDSDVQAALNIAIPGDLVSIPAGECTWGAGGTYVSVSKAVTLSGAGRALTTIDIDPTAGQKSSGTIRLTDAATVKSLTIKTPVSGTNMGTAFSTSANGFRITDITYLDQTPNAAGNGYFLYTSSYGLVDNVDVTGGDGQAELVFSRGPTDAWQAPATMGTAQAVYIENSTFGGLGYVNDCNSNGKCVIRYITARDNNKVDSHGKASNSSPPRGVRQTEVYNNVWSSTTSQLLTAMEIRGGTGMIFNNSAPNASNAQLYLTDMAYTGGPWGNFSNTYQCPANYPVDDQIGIGKDPKFSASEPMYLWGNTAVGSWWTLNPELIAAGARTYCNTNNLNGGDPNYTLWSMIRANRDYYVSSTSVAFDGTATGASAGVGSGLLSSRPATCTTGVAYWATDQGGSWDTSNGTSSDGALYKCTSTNTWTLSYTPYAYPHYLTAASSTGSDKVDVGAGARMFGNGKFYGYSTSTATGALAMIGATTTSSDPDAWMDLTIQTWSNSGTHHKAWTETSATLGATTTHHIVGDLSPSAAYVLTIDGSPAISNVSGGSCSAGACNSDASGNIYFDYTGGYSTHAFDLVQSAGIPSVTTDAPSSVTASGASLNGHITATGGADATQSGFAWGTGSSLSGGDTATTTEGAQTGAASYSSALASLACNTAYYSRAYATNANGSGYGSILSFTTSACAPTVTTGAASSIGQTSAVGNGAMSATGGANATVQGVVYGLTSSYTATSSNPGSFGVGAFTASISGLACNTAYHIAAFSTGPGGTTYGSDSTFMTTACAPTVTSASASGIDSDGATMNGSIASTGGANASVRGFVYGLTTAYGATTTEAGSHAAGAYTSYLSSLSCGASYHAAAYATGPGGTAYGSDVAFTTSACAVAPAPAAVSPSTSVARPSSSARRAIVAIASSAPAAQVPSIGAFIESLIAANIIPPEKAALARAAISAPAPASSVPATGIQYRDRGEAVRSLQVLLNQKGYLQAAPNGVFGPATLKALRSFQAENGVPATGYYGALTRAALQR